MKFDYKHYEEDKKINVMYTKDDFKCVDGFYYIGDVIDVDGNPWVDEEQLELIILELNNGWEDYQASIDQDNQRYEDSLK